MRLIAHRGRAGSDPENAIESMIRLPPWADGAEVDVQMSSDGVLVAMHDDTVDRTADGSGRVDELTAGELGALQLAPGVHVPRVEQYLASFRGTRLPELFIDVKHPEVQLIDEVVRLVAAAELSTRCVILARRAEQLYRARQLDATLTLGALGVTATMAADRLPELAGLDVDWVFLAPGDAAYGRHRHVIPLLREAGLRVGGSIIAAPEVLDQLVADGADIVITDRVADLQSWPWRSSSHRGRRWG